MLALDKQYQLVYDIQQTGYQHWRQMALGLVLILGGVLTFFARNQASNAIAALWSHLTFTNSISTRLLHGVARWLRLTPAFIILFGFLWVGSWSLNYLHYAGLREAVRRGHYEIVEGTVKEFVPMPYDGHAEESFVVSGKRFSYSDYDLSKGFNQTESHGGPIREGLRVRISYIGDSIVRVEVGK